ncbi:MAG TPA: glycosyltransferase family 4 protein, partial [Candidatus Limnocylindrales bacterium]|nr:glycosyltransferase family 4 protein [Candidatus Limnocylindrales bacterium]
PGFGMASGLSPRQILRWTSLLAGARAHAFLQRPARPGGHHLHAHFAARGAVGANVMSRAWGVPYSMTVHAYDLFLPNPRLPALTLGAALVVAISEYDRQELLRLVPAADPERITVIHAGVPVDELRAGGPGPQRPARERPLVVSVGRLVPKKGMDVLVRAVALLARDGIPVSCEIIGDGGERPRLEALIRKLGVEALVTLRGELLPAEARFRIAEADLFALACVRAPNGDMDGIPVALMEGMAVGTPVVSTRLSGIPELVTDDENGLLVEPGDPTYLAAAIRRLLDDRPFAHGLAVSAARTIADRFDQDANARLLLASITQARAAGPPGRLSPTGRP